MGDIHSFSVDVAKEVGVNAAILLQSIKWWCDKNKANDKNYHDGLYWTYNSVRAWQELYPYLGKSAINTALKKLEDRGYVKTGNYNKSAYDRTMWYAITEKGLSFFDSPIYRESKMEGEENANGIGEKQEPIPVAKQIHTDKSNIYVQDSQKAERDPRIPTLKQVEDYIAEKGYHFNASDFYAYYEASNWHLQTGKKITRWRMCCATWERNCKDKEAKKNELHERFKGYSAKTKKDTVYVNSAEMKDMYCAEGEDEWGLDEF